MLRSLSTSSIYPPESMPSTYDKRRPEITGYPASQGTWLGGHATALVPDHGVAKVGTNVVY